MYDMFNRIQDLHAGVGRPPAFELIRRTALGSLLTIKEYYRSRTFSVRSNHLLARIINTALPPLEYSLERYVTAASVRAPFMSRHFQLSSEVSSGTLHDGVFYGGYESELLLSVEEYFDPVTAIADWKNLAPVQVLEHHVTDMSLGIPNGTYDNFANDIAVISIDIPLLLLQYRGFLVEQQRTGSEQVLGPQQFIAAYVLPNMLDSHVDIVITNRLMGFFNGIPMAPGVRRHPFPLIDYTGKLDMVLKEVAKRITGQNQSYSYILQNIPAIVHEDARTALQMPDLARTRQVWWVLILTRLRIMEYLITVGGTRGKRRNKQEINKLKITVKRLLEDNVYQTMLGEDAYYDLNARLVAINDL